MFACMHAHAQLCLQAHTRYEHTVGHEPALSHSLASRASRSLGHAHTPTRTRCTRTQTRTRTRAVVTQWAMHPLPRTAWPPGQAGAWGLLKGTRAHDCCLAAHAVCPAPCTLRPLIAWLARVLPKEHSICCQCTSLEKCVRSRTRALRQFSALLATLPPTCPLCHRPCGCEAPPTWPLRGSKSIIVLQELQLMVRERA